ncbi:MAG: UvrD-helicase domain-containing protein [Proteobacteria bacterium]|nr:UvrD-helicase domain-containing protein [Pseudomonadota bacterium]
METGEKGKKFQNIRDLTFPHIYRVNASAGSGKTSALSDRFIELLLTREVKNNSLPNIIALTFTNKAVMEMN